MTLAKHLRYSVLIKYQGENFYLNGSVVPHKLEMTWKGFGSTIVHSLSSKLFQNLSLIVWTTVPFIYRGGVGVKGRLLTDWGRPHHLEKLVGSG